MLFNICNYLRFKTRYIKHEATRAFLMINSITNYESNMYLDLRNKA
jgi:hypothetical protein